ncbi:MAG: hypothetical protein IJN24_08685 [Bacteroidaceae bacterium]|nr:hypothetical protein [Bacteroidaceae bacterium]
MNKIYLEPASKARAFIDGVLKQHDVLAKKGISIHADELLAACNELEEAGRNQDEAELHLRIARDKAHKALDRLKELYSVAKSPVKQSFTQEQWASFGLTDKK